MPNPEKQLTHKSIAVRIPAYDKLQSIAKKLSDEKGVPVSIPSAIEVLINCWQQYGGKK